MLALQGTTALATEGNAPRQMREVVFDSMQEQISTTDSIKMEHWQPGLRPRGSPALQSRAQAQPRSGTKAPH